MWCIPDITPEFEKRMLDVLAQYETPYDPNEPRVNIDEKTSQLFSTPRGTIALKIGQASREDYEYSRHGTVNHFVCLEPKKGKRSIKVTSRRTAKDFAKFMRHIVTRVYAKAKHVHLTIDNLNTHTNKAILDHYGEKRGQLIVKRIVWHYTPKHASWLNAAEIEIGTLTASVLKKRIPDRQTLTREVRAYVHRQNRDHATVHWQFTQEKAKKKFKLE